MSGGGRVFINLTDLAARIIYNDGITVIDKCQIEIYYASVLSKYATTVSLIEGEWICFDEAFLLSGGDHKYIVKYIRDSYIEAYNAFHNSRRHSALYVSYKLRRLIMRPFYYFLIKAAVKRILRRGDIFLITGSCQHISGPVSIYNCISKMHVHLISAGQFNSCFHDGSDGVPFSLSEGFPSGPGLLP